MFILALPIVLAFIGLAFTWGQRSLVLAQLQARVDAAAHGGGAALCSSEACYNASRQIAIALLNDATFDFFRDHLATTLASDPGETARYWNVSPMEVKIYRGRWWGGNAVPPDSPDRPAENVVFLPEAPWFEPFETQDMSTNDWQNLHPGIPDYVVANAVFVEVRLSNTNSLSNIFGSILPSLKQDYVAHAIAVGGDQGVINVAPFAIPVCSLINQAGEYRSDQCEYDRFVTSADRYCGDGVDCDVMPGFGVTWSSLDMYPTDPGPRLTATGLGGRNFLKVAGTSDPAWSQPSDQFMVSGIPHKDDVSLTVTEDMIVDLLNNKTAVPTQIGDRFEILYSGLTTSAASTALDNLLNGLTTGNLALRQGLITDFMTNTQALLNKGVTRLDHRDLLDPEKTVQRSPYESGMCNTSLGSLQNDFIFHLGAVAKYGKYCAEGDWTPGGGMHSKIFYYMFYPNSSPSIDSIAFNTASNSRAVETIFPVIADMTGRPCASEAGAARDPLIARGIVYRVVGFMRGYIYDYDIGQAPPAPLDSIVMSGDLTGLVGSTLLADGNTRVSCPHFGDNIIPYQFQVGGVQRNCNVIRMKTACDVDLIPTVQVVGGRTPRLVN